MPPKKEVQTISLGVSSKQVFVSGKDHLGTHGRNIGMNNPTFKAGSDPSPNTRLSRFMDITDSDQYKPKEVYLKFFEKEKPKSTDTVLKDFTIPESTRIVHDYGGEATADRYPKDLVMMMGVVAKMIAGSIPAFWWCIGLPFLRGSSQPAEVVVITDIKKFYTERWAAEKEASLGAKKKTSVQEIDDGEESDSDDDESESEEESDSEEEADSDDDEEESEEEVLDDTSGDEGDSASDDEEVAPVSKRAQKKKAKKRKDESDSEEPELPPSVMPSSQAAMNQ